MLRLRDNVDFSTINWTDQAHMTRRYAEGLPPGDRRNAEMDRALACEALAHSGYFMLQTTRLGQMVGVRVSKAKRSRSQIAMDDGATVRRWTKHLKVTKDELQCAVDKVGNSAVAVRKQIGLGR